MAGADAGLFDRMIAILRAESVDDRTAVITGVPAEIARRSAARTDISDGEQVRAAENGQEVSSWFIVRYDSLTSTITGKDMLIDTMEDESFEVTGTKLIGRRDRIEITAVARPDMARPQ